MHLVAAHYVKATLLVLYLACETFVGGDSMSELLPTVSALL